MKLENLLPRPLNPSAGGESVTVMNALFARVHLDRRLARSIGWRGVRPSFSHGQAWTMRSAAADAVFGLAFIDETAADGLLSGRFAVYAFPDPETPAWSSLPPEAKSLAELPDFREKVRSLSEHAAALGVFRTGEMVLDIALNGCGLALTLSAQEKSEDSSADPFERSAPLFALLAQSLRAELEEEGEALKLAETNEAGETMLSITLALGRFVGLLPGERLESLPGAHVPKEEESQQRPVIHVLTGFLGAGKTTFLKSWLAYLNGRERFTGVVQNEFGEVDLDSLVLRGETKVEALDDGCVCCTLADSLRRLEETALTRPVSPSPFVPAGAGDRAERCQEILTIAALGLKKRLEHTGAGCAVVGLSGGLDSTLALLITARAMDLLGRPRTDILAVTMPCFGTTSRTKSNAQLLAEHMGASFRTVDIGEAVRVHFRDIGQSMEDLSVTFENGQARERTQVLMDLANQRGGLVVGTGDLSELALGWATYNGDHMSMYGVNGSIPKTLVRHLVAYSADQAEGSDPELAAVLRDILATPVSPELLPPKEGEIAQKTEDLVGPYELHDFFLYYAVRWGFSPRKVFRLARYALGDRYDRETILKWLNNFYRRFFAQQFKRSCLPDGPKVGSLTLSPRGDWRMPSDAVNALWRKELEELGK